MKRRMPLLALIGSATCLISSQVSALAMAEAHVSLGVEIVSIVNNTTPGDFSELEIFGEAFVFDSGSEFTGPIGIASHTATATPSPEIALGVGDDLSLSFDLTTAADGNDALATAFSILDGIIFFDNFSATDEFVISVDITVSADGVASITGPDDENAFTSMELFVGTDGLNIIDILFTASLSSDILSSGTVPVGTGTPVVISHDITLAPNAFDSLFLLAIGSTEAESVPVPASLTLLLAGLLLVGRKKISQ